MNKTYSHCCGTCYKTYFSYEADRLFCCSHCEAFYMRNGRGYKYDITSKPGPKPKPKIIPIKQEEPEEVKKPKKKVDLKNIMYRDMFKSYIPRGLKVMRG